MALQNRRFNYAWVVVFLCALIMFLSGFVGGYHGLWLSSVTEGLGISRTAFSLSNSFRFATVALISVVFSAVLNRLGMRKTFALGFASLILAMQIYATAEAVWLFYVAGTFMGIGVGLACSAIVSIFLKQWITKNLGTVMGFVFACSGLGAAVGSQVMTPILFQEGNPLGFRDAYKLNAVVLLIAAVIILVLLREKKEDFEAETVQKRVLTSRKKKQDDTPITSKVFLCFVVVCVFLCNALLMGINSVYSAHMRDVGLSTGIVAGAASVLSVMLIASKTLTGVIFDRFGLRFVLILCQLATLIGFGILVFLNNGTQTGAVIFAIVFSLALPLETIVVPLIVEELFGKKEYNRVLGFSVAASNVGFAVGPPIVNLFYDASGTYVPAIYVCMALMAVIMIVFQIVITIAHK